MTSWQRRATSQTRTVPQLLPSNKFHGPARAIKPIKRTSGVIEGNSENWSGYVITDASNPFVKPRSQVEARFIVPKTKTSKRNARGRAFTVRLRPHIRIPTPRSPQSGVLRQVYFM
jgi:hypothetical protein